jgi:hypothetical protein
MKGNGVAKNSSEAPSETFVGSNKPSGDSFWQFMDKEVKAQRLKRPEKNVSPAKVLATSVVTAAAAAAAAAAAGEGKKDDDEAVHKVPPRNWRQVQGMFRVLLAMGDVDHISLTINGETGLYYRQDDAISSQAQTYHFIVGEREREKLYWYTEYACIMTNYNIYVEMCGMSNGDVILAVWETRCARPFQSILVWRKKEDDVVLVKCADYRRANPKVELDPTLEFDKDKALM